MLEAKAFLLSPAVLGVLILLKHKREKGGRAKSTTVSVCRKSFAFSQTVSLFQMEKRASPLFQAFFPLRPRFFLNQAAVFRQSQRTSAKMHSSSLPFLKKPALPSVPHQNLPKWQVGALPKFHAPFLRLRSKPGGRSAIPSWDSGLP